MSTRIRDIVPVSFSIGSFNVSGQNFQTPLIMSETTRQEERTLSFTSLSEMVDAGYLTTDTEYLAAQDLLAQTSKDGLKVTTFKVGKKYKSQDAMSSIVFDTDATAGTFTVDISLAGAASVTSGAINWNDNAAAVKAVIDAMANVTSVTVTLNAGATQAGDAEGFSIDFDGDADTDLQVTAVNVSALTSVTTATITQVHYGTAAETWTQGYNNIKAYDNDWYYLLPTTITKADLLLLAAALESDTDPHFGFFGSRDADILTATADNIAEELQDASYSKCCLTYTDDTDNLPNMCWAGATIPDKLWGINPCIYPLSSITGSDLNSTQIANLYGQNCNRIETIGGQTIVPGTASGQSGNAGGISPDGSYIDQVVATDYLNARVSEEVYALLLASKKVPFNVDGSNLIKSVIEGAMQTYGVDEGIVNAGSVTVTMPDLDTYSTTKKAQRWLDGIVGDGEATGAINKITISFNLTV